MVLRLQSNKNIKGITFEIDENNHSIKISQLSDDITLFMSSKEITSVLHEIEIFGSLSGLVLNRNKTQGMWVGKFKKCKDKIHAENGITNQ